MKTTRLLATLWAGSLWGVAIIMAVAFHTGPRELAGAMAASVFSTIGWLSITCGVLLLMSRQARNLALGMLVCAVVIAFGIQPMLAALKEAAGPQGIVAAGLGREFGILHGLSALFYGAECLMGAMLVLRLR